MKQAVASAVKEGLRQVGHYRRALASARFSGVAVLAYHGLRRDDEPAGTMPFANLHVRESTFAAHCEVVREMCDPIALDDWRRSAADGAPLPPRPVLITFDDGYRSVCTIAAPILAEMRLPAVVFVCSGPIHDRSLLWFDSVAEQAGEASVEPWKERPYGDWLAVRQTRRVAEDDPRALMTSDELRALSRQTGIEIGGHTVAHPILARAPLGDQRREILQNRAHVEEWIGRRVRAFAFPNGRPGVDYTAETVEILRASGFDSAFTTRNGLAMPGEDALERSRFTIVDEMSGTELAHRLAYSWQS